MASRSTMLLTMIALAACGGEPSPLGDGQSWSEADRLFESSADWRGGDSAYSQELSQGRVLWLFGDSFVGPGDDPQGREGQAMVRNTIGIQTGADPSTATIEFFHGGTPEAPAPFFGEAGPPWLWPGPSLRSGQAMMLTFMVVDESSEGLGFETIGGEARRVINPDEPPAQWVLTPVPLPEHPAGARLGAGALMRNQDFVYAYAPVEPGNHDVYVARWPVAEFDEGRLSEPQWYGNRWSTAEESDPVVRGVQSEFSVVRVDSDTFWMVHVRGFGGTDVVGRVAKRPEGPWSVPRRIYDPPESSRDGVLIYSAKAHPGLEGAGVVVSYCTNHTDFATTVGDLGLYFPRFVRVQP